MISLHHDRRIRTLARRVVLATLVIAGVMRSTPAQAIGTWYVDNTNVKATDIGPGTPEKPYRTIMGALAAHRDSGVTLVVRGGPYREKVVIDVDGTGRAPIVVRTAGTPVVIDGADDFSSPGQWLPVAGNVWLAPTVNWAPAHVFADGLRLVPSTDAPGTIAAGTWTFVPGTGLYVNAGGGSPASHQAAVTRRSHGFFISGRSHIFIDGFTIQRTEDKGVELIGVADVVVKRNVIRQCGSAGVGVRASAHVQVYGNTVSENNHHGIEFREGVTNSIIDHNESFANAHVGEAWATGIYLAGSPHNLIEANRLHDNQDSGCEIQTGSNDNLVLQNISWSNGDHGFAQLYATGTILLNDVAWGNHTEGFSVEGGSSGTQIYNSISLNRALAPESYCVYVDSSSTAGFAADYDIYWNIADQAPIKFGKVAYANVAAFQTATGIGPNTFGADPRFVDAVHGDFHLRWDSPAIDAATTEVPGWDVLDADGFMRTDSPDTPNTGAGPVGFADRGALEFLGGVLAVAGEARGAHLALSSAYPNPGRRAVAFTLRLGEASDVSWSVFDVLGREVWSEHGVRAAGTTTLNWALTDHHGAPVPNGVYLARVRRGDETATARFTVAR